MPGRLDGSEEHEDASEIEQKCLKNTLIAFLVVWELAYVEYLNGVIGVGAINVDAFWVASILPGKP